MQVNLKESVPQIGAPEAWAAGYDGKGVKVAVLDTGIDADHPDLSHQIDGTASFVPGEDMTDINGHGTHVASHDRRHRRRPPAATTQGVAPGADLIVGKVLGDTEGSGQDSWVLAGMEWAADVRGRGRQHEPRRRGARPTAATRCRWPSTRCPSSTARSSSIAAGNSGPETHLAPRRGRVAR